MPNFMLNNKFSLLISFKVNNLEKNKNDFF
jgi:hypothetical protein